MRREGVAATSSTPGKFVTLQGRRYVADPYSSEDDEDHLPDITPPKKRSANLELFKKPGKKQYPSATSVRRRSPRLSPKRTESSSHEKESGYLTKMPDLSDDQRSDRGDSGSWYSTQSTKGTRKRAHTDTAMLQVMQDRSKMYEKLTDSVAAMTHQSAAAAAKPPEEDSVDSLWAKSLVMHMKRMEQRIKDRFMVHVYEIAMDAIGGKMP